MAAQPTLLDPDFLKTGFQLGNLSTNMFQTFLNNFSIQTPSDNCLNTTQFEYRLTSSCWWFRSFDSSRFSSDTITRTFEKDLVFSVEYFFPLVIVKWENLITQRKIQVQMLRTFRLPQFSGTFFTFSESWLNLCKTIKSTIISTDKQRNSSWIEATSYQNPPGSVR